MADRGAEFAAFQTAAEDAPNPTPTNPCKALGNLKAGDCSSAADGHFAILDNTKDCSSVTLHFPNSGDEKFFVYKFYFKSITINFRECCMVFIALSTVSQNNSQVLTLAKCDY